MFGGLKGRILILLLVVGAAAGFLYANGLKLGLDLQGGMHLALEVSDPEGTLTPEMRREHTDQNLHIIRNRIDQFGVAEPLVQKVGDDRIIVELPGIRDEARARGIIEASAFLEFKHVRPTMPVVAALQQMDRVVAAAIETDPTLAAEAPATPQTGVQDLIFRRPETDTLAADTAAVDTAAAADTAAAPAVPSAPVSRPLSGLMFEGGDGEFLVAEEQVTLVKRYLSLPGVMDRLPRGVELRWGARPIASGAVLYRPLYVLESRAFLTGERLVEATAGRDPQFNMTVVNFALDRRGGRAFGEATGANIGNRIAIVLDTLVHSAPRVNSRIEQRGVIEMQQAPMTEARDLALVLRAGALTFPLEIVEQRSVGPSLGRDSIERGQVAGLIGLALIVLIMIVYYRVAGILAVGALTAYVLILLGGLAALDATLTAPGIAGFILSIGMAVDANVLIFERIREELSAGRTPRAAVDDGFQHAMSAIVDSNLTTLITALILFQIGTGPVQGFAVTLSIGIIASFFSAVFITRTFFLLYLERKRAADPISI
jgi:preprotein translocase subunit SecD